MLKHLHIHNYAIIDEIAIDFSGKLNVITGETGAGKSILMGALSLILGDRADTSVFLNRQKKCIVEGTFAIDNNQTLRRLLAEHDLDGGEMVSESETDDATIKLESSPDEEIVIRREIGVSGKSRAFINDTPVNLDQLRQISLALVDLHRQFDTLALADSGFQRDVIDALAGNNDLLQRYQQTYRSWKKERSDLDGLLSQKLAFNKEFDYHKFLFDELEEAALTANELEEAEAELKILGNSESIKNALEQVSMILNEGDQPVVQQVKIMQNQLQSYASLHSGLEELLKRLQSAQIELQDIAEEADRLNDHMGFDAERINMLNERISTGYKLLKKHGVNHTGDLIAIKDDLAGKLEAVMNIDEAIAKKGKIVEALQKQTDEQASKLSVNRRKQLVPLEEKVNLLLVQVGMPNAKLQARIQPQDADIYGRDAVEFLFDANKSGRFEPLRKVASGGELSRLMLSIKSLVAESMDLPTLIFDEIDSGISGEAAKQVGIIMSRLSSKRQVIAITHQPQIAGKADAHFFVFKEIRDDRIHTSIRLLSGEERITIIAQMLGGEKPTAAALANAREMVLN